MAVAKAKIEALKDRLLINKHGLDDEFIQQPSLFFEVSETYVLAVSTRDALKEELATVDAELDGVMRKAAEKRSERITEPQVKMAIQSHPKHTSASNNYLEAKEAAALLEALKESFSQRSYMLRDLASLYVANYYEQSSMQGTNSSEKVQYQQRRQKLADARQGRNG